MNEYLNLFGLLLQSISQERHTEKKNEERINGKKLIGDLTFKHVDLNPEYAKKWNERSTDFGHLYNKGKKLSDTLYRIGGLV